MCVKWHENGLVYLASLENLAYRSQFSSLCDQRTMDKIVVYKTYVRLLNTCVIIHS